MSWNVIKGQTSHSHSHNEMQILIIKCKCTCGMISIKEVKVKVDPYSRFKSNWLLPNRRERWKCPTVSTDIEAATTLTSNPASTISLRWLRKVSSYKLISLEYRNCVWISQVIASEDWNGMREDFKMASDVITFRVDYAPRVSTQKSHHEQKAQILLEISLPPFFKILALC